MLLPDAVEVLVNAQRTMRCCCVFRWHAKKKERKTGPLELLGRALGDMVPESVRFWLGELETASSTLQAALGPSFQAAWEPRSETKVHRFAVASGGKMTTWQL